MSKIRRITVVVASLAFVAVAAEAQPSMKEALRHLEQAEAALEDARANKNGHRRDAIQHTRAAIHDVRLGMKRDREQSGGREHHSEELSPRALRACARAADDYWGLRAGASVPHNVRERKEGRFKVEVSARHRHGYCFVDERGDVKKIEDA